MQHTKRPAPRGHRERYTHGYRAVSRQMALRTAESHASFLLPYLKPGMSLLDCGCGPGTITVGLAQAVAPGEAIGIDIAPSEVRKARRAATAQGVSNARFDAASAYELPFADETFDAIFSHAMLEHMGDTRRAIGEMWRVLKPGGLIGLRGSILRGHVWHPEDSAVTRAFDVWLKVWRSNGGEPDLGLVQPAALREAGFEVLSSTASFDADFHEGMGWSIGRLLLQPAFVETATQRGWADQSALQELRQDLLRWSGQPSAVWYLAWGEAVGCKPPRAR